MIRALCLVAVGMFALLLPRSAEACAGCSNPNLPTGRAADVRLRPGAVSASLNVTGTMMNVVHSEHCPDIGPICQVRDEPDQLHDQDFYVGELRPVVDVGITDTFGIEAQLPFRITRTAITFRRLDGEPFVPDYENIHHRNETLYGLSDPWLSGRGAWWLGEWTLRGKAGVTVPLGRIEPDPFALGREGQPHQHIQFGTGTFNPVLGADVARRFGALQVNAYAQALLFLYENRYGYRAGNRYLGGVGVERPFGDARRLRVGLGVDVLNEQSERWSGEIQQDGNVGRTDVLAGGTVSYRFDDFTALLSVKTPVWQQFIEAGHAHEGDPGQLTYPAIVNLGFHRTFGGR